MSVRRPSTRLDTSASRSAGAVRYLRQPDRATEPAGTERRKESLTCSFSLSVPVPEPEAVRRVEGGDPRFWVLADAAQEAGTMT